MKISTNSTTPTSNIKTPKNLAGPRKEGEWPAYQTKNARGWALQTSGDHEAVKEFFDTTY